MKKTSGTILIIAAIVAVLVSVEGFAQPVGRAGRGQRLFSPQMQPFNPPVYQPDVLTPDGPPYGDFGLACPNPLGPYAGLGRGGANAPGFGMRAHGRGFGAQDYGPGWGMQGPGGGILMLRVLRLLNLTEEQQEQIRTILKEKKEPMEAARTAVQNATQALHQAVIEEKGEDPIRTAAQALGEAIGQQAILRASIATSIKAVLTEEQIKKLDELKKQSTQWLGPPGLGARTQVQRQPAVPEPNQPTPPFPLRQGRRGRW